MQLPLREFSEVISRLRAGDVNPKANSEQRKTTRMIIAARIDVFLINPATKSVRTFSALTRDISLDGAGLMQSIALPEGVEILLALPRGAAIAASGPPLFVCGRVTHCRTLADGILAIGVQFTRVAPEELVELITSGHNSQVARLRQAVLD
jgi:hypothetical protein